MKLFIFFYLVLSTGHSFAADFIKFSKKDKETFIQSLIDRAELQTYLHPEIKGRLPLMISSDLIGSDLELTKYSKKVLLIKRNLIDKPFIDIYKIECASKFNCDIDFKYLVEGVKGEASIFLHKGKAIVHDFSITEK